MVRLTKAVMWSVDTLGDWLLLNTKLGHSDLVYGFYRAKFINRIVFQWEQDMYIT